MLMIKSESPLQSSNFGFESFISYSSLLDSILIYEFMAEECARQELLNAREDQADRYCVDITNLRARARARCDGDASVIARTSEGIECQGSAQAAGVDDPVAVDDTCTSAPWRQMICHAAGGIAYIS